MKQAPIYLDYNATTPILPEARDAMMRASDCVGNPSSVHGFGREARRTLEEARETMGKVLGCDPINITFTSGATEANNWMFSGSDANTVLISAIEHPCVIEAARHFHKNVRIIPVNAKGVVDMEALEKELSTANGKKLVSVMAVNNETGVIQPFQDIAVLCHQYDALYHCDAVQALGKIPFDINKSGADFVSLSAHKIGGPAGIGALIFTHHLNLPKLIHGGGQERRRRAGTENLMGIAGFAEAVKMSTDKAHKNTLKAMKLWRDQAEKTMTKAIPQAIIFGQDADRTPNTIAISLPGVPAQTQLMNLDMAGFAVSTGSACSSGSVKPSHVLQAMGVDDAVVNGTLRISMGWNTTENDIQKFTAAWIEMAERLMKK